MSKTQVDVAAAQHLVHQWFQRSRISPQQAISRAREVYAAFQEQHLQADQLSTNPEAAVALVTAFVDGVDDERRCTAEEAIHFLERLHLPLDRRVQIGPLFPEAEWQQAWGGASKEWVSRLVQRWIDRSGLTIRQVTIRANMTQDELNNGYRRYDRSIATDPDKAIAIVRAFSERLREDERCAAEEAIIFLCLTQLPLHRYAELRPLFPPSDWAVAWQQFVSWQTPPVAAPKFEPDPSLVAAVPLSPNYQQPILVRYGRDLTQLARLEQLHAVGSRRDEMVQIISTWSRLTRRSPLLVGEVGTGRTTIVEGLAWRLAQGNVRPEFRSARIIQLSLARLAVGSRDEVSARFHELITEASRSQVIIFFDQIHPLVRGGTIGAELAELLRLVLTQPDLRCIAETTPAEYHYLRTEVPDLEALFQPISVEELTEEASLDVLHNLQPRYERHYKVIIGLDALNAAVSEAIRCKQGPLPRSAIELLDRACAAVRTQRITEQPASDLDLPNTITAAVVQALNTC